MLPFHVILIKAADKVVGRTTNRYMSFSSRAYLFRFERTGNPFPTPEARPNIIQHVKASAHISLTLCGNLRIFSRVGSIASRPHSLDFIPKEETYIIESIFKKSDVNTKLKTMKIGS
jgi:hypothetical protein